MNNGVLGYPTSPSDAYVLLSDVTLGNNTGNGVTWTPFPAIPQNYTHLRVYLIAAQEQGSTDVLDCRLNQNSSGTYGFDGALVSQNWNESSMPIGRVNSLTSYTDVFFPDYTKPNVIKMCNYSTITTNALVPTMVQGASICGTSGLLNTGIFSLSFLIRRAGNSIAKGSRAMLYGIR